MKNSNIFLISLDEFCTKWKYDNKQKLAFKELLSDTDALIFDDGIDNISLNPYMNYTQDGLELCKVKAHKNPTLKNILDYDSVCRIYLEEWIHLSAEVQRAYATRPPYIRETDFMENMSDLTSAVKKVTEYFQDAQDLMLVGPTDESVENDEKGE